jgi:hypothetical protein
MGKLIAPLGVLIGAAVWFLLFVILGTGLGTAFIAGGAVVATAVTVPLLVAAAAIFDAPLTFAGLAVGVATFVVLEVVLSVTMWVDIVSGLGAIGLYNLASAAIRLPAETAPSDPRPEPRYGSARPFAAGYANGHDREPVGAR